MIYKSAKNWLNTKNSFTLILIPHAPLKKTKSVKFSNLAISTFIILNTIMFIFISILSFSYYTLSTKLNNIKSENELLLKVKERDESELSKYKASEKQVKDKVQTLMELENKLRDIIEAKNGRAQSEVDRSTKLATRGAIASQPGYKSDRPETSVLMTSENIRDTVDRLSEQIDCDIKELNTTVLKPKNLINVMRAKPLVLPTYGQITSGFGYRKNPFGDGYEFHYALDIANSQGTPIRASGDGVVTHAGWESGYGILVKINHENGYESLYGHNSKLDVKLGDRVKRGQVIAYMGDTGRATGSHCHFEIKFLGKPVNPYDIK